MKKKIKLNMEVRKGDKRGMVVGESPLSTRKCQVMWNDSGATWEYKSDLKPV